MMTYYKQNKLVKFIEGIKTKVRDFFNKIKVPVAVICVLIGLTAGVLFSIHVINWFNGHLVILRSPVQNPVVIKEVTKDTEKGQKPQDGQKTPVKSISYEHLTENKAADIDLKSMTPGQIAYEAYKTTRFKESSNGKKVGQNAYCLGLGMINEVGYDPQHSFCFANRDEQVATSINWFRNCLAKDTLNNCLSVYSSSSYSEIYYE